MIPFLQKKYKTLLLEVNGKGMELFKDDPRFRLVGHWDPLALPDDERMSGLMKRTVDTAETCKKQGWDHLPLLGSIEAACLNDDERGDVLNLPREEIEARYNRDFYERHFEMAGIQMPDGWVHEPTIRFSPLETASVERWNAKTREYFKVFVTIGGSSIQKVFPTWMPSFCKTLVDEFPFAVVYLFGDKETTDGVWEYQRTVNYVHGCSDINLGFKQVLLMHKYADYAFGGETGTMIGAGMFGTPKTILCTLANKDQIVRHHRNDYSLQSQAWCSPCYTMAYSGLICQKEIRYQSFPICTDKFDLDALWGSIERKYQRWMVK